MAVAKLSPAQRRVLEVLRDGAWLLWENGAGWLCGTWHADARVPRRTAEALWRHGWLERTGVGLTQRGLRCFFRISDAGRKALGEG